MTSITGEAIAVALGELLDDVAEADLAEVCDRIADAIEAAR